jgi:hypothetical protein
MLREKGSYCAHSIAMVGNGIYVFQGWTARVCRGLGSVWAGERIPDDDRHQASRLRRRKMKASKYKKAPMENVCRVEKRAQ